MNNTPDLEATLRQIVARAAMPMERLEAPFLPAAGPQDEAQIEARLDDWARALSAGSWAAAGTATAVHSKGSIKRGIPVRIAIPRHRCGLRAVREHIDYNLTCGTQWPPVDARPAHYLTRNLYSESADCPDPSARS